MNTNNLNRFDSMLEDIRESFKKIRTEALLEKYQYKPEKLTDKQTVLRAAKIVLNSEPILAGARVMYNKNRLIRFAFRMLAKLFIKKYCKRFH